MPSLLQLDNITIKQPQGSFNDPIEFEITLTSLQPLSAPLEWQVIYVGSAKSQEHDQILEEFEIDLGSVPSTSKFEFECSSPKAELIPMDQLLSVTALIITINYKKQQCIRVGYYVHNQFTLGEDTDLSLLSAQEIAQNTKRYILYDKPRITKFDINWQQKQSTAELQSNSNSIHSHSYASMVDKHQSTKQEQVLMEQQIRTI